MTFPEDDLEPTEAERAEAEALARALDGEARAGEANRATQDALEVAALVAYSRGASRLTAEELEAGAERAFEAGRPARRKRRALMVLAPATALLVAAAALLVVRSLGGSTERAAILPAPSTALIRAQARAAGGSSEALDAAMKHYRSDVLAALSAKYGGPR